MDDEQPTVAEHLTQALMIALLKRGVIDDEDLIEAAASLGPGEQSETAVHLINCAILRASLPEPTQMAAERARSRLRIVPPDGGNPTT